MYKFYIENDLNKFDQFVLKNNGSIFQTSMGAKQKSAWNSIYIMAEDNEKKTVLSCLILVRKIAKIMKMGYIPLGFVCDYSNKTLVEEAIKYIKGITKKERIGICFIDPTVVLSKNGDINDLGVKCSDIFSKAKLKKTLKDRPYIQPDTTYIIDLANEQGHTKTIDEIVNTFEKGVRYSIRTSLDKGLKYETFIYPDVAGNPKIMDEFMNIMDETMDRLEASTRSKHYFTEMLKNFEPYARLNMVYYDAKADQEKFEQYKEELLELQKNEKQNNKRITEITSKMEGYQKRIAEIEGHNIKISENSKLYLAGGLTVIFGNKAICLYGGSKNILRNAARPSHYLNYKRIEDSINSNCLEHDLSRIQLKYKDERDRDYGLYLFKRSFNADEIKYIGEYTFINNYFMYFLFINVLPLFRAIMKKLKGTK